MSPAPRLIRFFQRGERTRIVDRRGKILPLCSIKDLPDHGPPALYRAFWSIEMASGLFTIKLIFLVVTTSVIGWGIINVARGRPFFWRLGALSIGGGVALFSMLLTVIAGRLGAADHGRRALAACLAARLCPSCGHDLSGVTPDPDTFLVCTECGGSWPSPESPNPPV